MCSKCQQELDPTPLQAWRAASGLSVELIAALCGCTPMTIQRALRGEPISAETFAALHELTGLSPEELCHDQEEDRDHR